MKKITRIQVIEKAKEYLLEHPTVGLCYSITIVLKAEDVYGKVFKFTENYIPLFTRENAMQFGASDTGTYWWPQDELYTGRLDFLNWLIEQYQDDDTNLFELKEKFYLESVELFGDFF